MFSAGPGGYHGGPSSGGDPSVSGVLPALLLSSPLPHTPPPPLFGSSSLYSQLFLPPCEPRGAAAPPVLPAPPPPHVRRPRYCPDDRTCTFCQSGDKTPKYRYSACVHIFNSLLSSFAEIIPVIGMSNYIGREDTYSKPQPKKIKEQRQLERQNRLNSPPSTLYKSSLGLAHNGYR